MACIPEFEQNNPYNIFAMLISHIRELDKEFFDSQDHRRSFEINKHCTEAIDHFLETYPELSDPYKCLYVGISSEAVDAITHWPHYDTVLYDFALLLKFDSLCHWEAIAKSSPLVEMHGSYSSLNDNAGTTGIHITLRVPSISDDLTPSLEPGIANDATKTWAYQWEHGIHCDLKNIDYIVDSDLNVGEKHYEMDHIIVDSALALDTKRNLTIAVSPLAKDIHLNLEKKEIHKEGGTQHIFNVTGIDNPERVHNRVAAAHLLACREHADILAFPEMLADQEMLGIDQEYSKMFEKFSQIAGDEGLPAPFLIIGPTIWHEGKNEVHVLDESGSRLCIQQKQNAFALKEGDKTWKENLISPEPVVHILHLPGFGRIAIPICKDLLTTDYRDLLTKTLHCTLVICPSFSPGKTSFGLAAARDREFGCYVIWINTCSAYDKDRPLSDHVGYVSSPTLAEPSPFIRQCQNYCGTDTTACLFLIDIPLDRTGSMQATLHQHIHAELSREA